MMLSMWPCVITYWRFQMILSSVAFTRFTVRVKHGKVYGRM